MSWIRPEYISRDFSLTKEEQAAIYRDAWKLWWSNRWNIVLYLVLVAFYLIAVFFACDVGGGVATFLGVGGVAYKLFRAGGPVVLLAICFFGGGAFLHRIRFSPCVYLAMRRHGYDVCPQCGYWLRGLDDEVSCCPECGSDRAPSDEAGVTISPQSEESD